VIVVQIPGSWSRSRSEADADIQFAIGQLTAASGKSMVGGEIDQGASIFLDYNGKAATQHPIVLNPYVGLCLLPCQPYATLLHLQYLCLIPQ
jgi:hypothetical protein